MTGVNRRSVLGAGLGGLLLASCKTQGITPSPRHELGIQLYTIMDLLDADMDAALAAVAQVGYRQVETLGSFGRDPVEFRAMLDRHGLVTASQHIMPPGLYEVFNAGVAGRIDRETFERQFIEAFSFDRVDELIEACAVQARALGQKYITWQISWPSQLETVSQVEQLVRALNRAADTARANGLTLAYHNHSQEFDRVGNDVPYDLILENTDPDKTVFEMDLAWTVNAGVDPLDYFERYPGRFRMLHMKDIASDGSVRDAGQGIVPFERIIPAAKAVGVEQFYVEYDVPTDPLATAANARRQLLQYM